MKRFAMLSLATMIMTVGIGCCGSPFGGGYGGGYQQPYSPACPGGNCGTGYGYIPQNSAMTPYGAPVAAAPGYYNPAPATAMNYLPTY